MRERVCRQETGKGRIGMEIDIALSDGGRGYLVLTVAVCVDGCD